MSALANVVSDQVKSKPAIDQTPFDCFIEVFMP